MTRLSIVVLTLDEERDIGPCLASLADQEDQRSEVIVIDAASQDRTVDIVREAQDGFPVPLRLVACQHRLAIGTARNLGVDLAKADKVAFLSADAELDPGWVKAALAALETHDMVYGRQIHDPHAWTTAAAIRGLRYRFPDHPVDDPIPYASNVAAAYTEGLLVEHPFEPGADAAEDLLIAQRAQASGYRVTYDPALVVHHHDVTTFDEELTKNLREGRGWGKHADELGLMPHLIGWGLALLASLLILPIWPIPGLAALILLAYLPALRRAVKRRHALPPGPLVKGVLASPPFDLAFLATYLQGLVQGLFARSPSHPPEEAQA